MKKMLMSFVILAGLLAATACNAATRLSPEELQQAIFVAAREDDVDAMKQYIEAGADINQAEDGVTVLEVASLRGNLELITLLLDSGAQYDAGTFRAISRWGSYCWRTVRTWSRWMTTMTPR
jgi:hypothetical protein